MARARSKPTENTVAEGEVGVPVEQCLLIQDEIWRIVSDAERHDSCLSVTREARNIADAFPASGLSEQNIIDALVFAAVDIGVAVEIAKPATRPAQRPTIVVPGLLALVGGRRKAANPQKPRPTFAGVAMPATS